jgi:hypothetical protein
MARKKQPFPGRRHQTGRVRQSEGPVSRTSEPPLDKSEKTQDQSQIPSASLPSKATIEQVLR